MTTKAQTQFPDSPGIWWFVGKAIVPHSPTNASTVHIETPRRFLFTQTRYGLIPHEPDTFHPYPDVEFVGEWTKGLGQ